MTSPSSGLADRAAQFVRENGLIQQNEHILAAVSGGPDSVALLDILSRLKNRLAIGRITVVHFNHLLRGEESDADEEFVRALATGTGLDFRRGSADVLARAHSRKISLEMSARECRHAFFKKTATELSARAIALGHTADDQAEEVLLRLLRGTGPAGMQGMRPKGAGGIIRPLLFATREEIVEHLREHGLQYREDQTNSEPFCQRNLLRLEVLPVLRKAFHPRVAATVSRHAELAREEEAWWAGQVDAAWASLSRGQSRGVVSLDLGGLRALHPALLRRVLRLGIEKVRGNLSGIALSHLDPLLLAIRMEKPGKSFRFPGNVEALQRGGRLVIEKIRREARSADESVEIGGPGVYRFGSRSFEVEIREMLPHGVPPEQSGAECAVMDEAGVKWPMRLRFWNPGDRFRPLGMTGSKKLQDFFVDSRVPREERNRVPILCDAEKICWVSGLRLDERVRVRPGTNSLVCVRMLAPVRPTDDECRETP